MGNYAIPTNNERLPSPDKFIYEKSLSIGMSVRKKGQAAGAAVLVVIIAAMLIGFIVLVDPQERAEILGETTTVSTTLDVDSAENLLLTKPGRIDFLDQEDIEHPLPTINIYTKTETVILAEKNIVQVKNAAFVEEASDFVFAIPDLENTENILLSFDIKEAQGTLIVTSAGQEIYSAELTSGVEPIKIPKSILNEQNTFTFAVSSPGAAFWKTNDIILENVKIVADVTSLEAQSSENIFLVSETEKKNLEKVLVKFHPQCVYGKVGKLLIEVNGDAVHNAVPDCDLPMVPIEISPDRINLGENTISFHTEKGTYILSSVVIESELKEVEFPTFYFDLSHEDYLGVEEENYKLRLAMAFVDVVASKKGQIVFNGHRKYFDTNEISIGMDLSDDVVEGSNSVKIKPKKTLEIRELRVDLVE